jgi:hypothetical protein
MHTLNGRAASGKATPVVRSVKSTADNTNTENEHQGETALSAAMCRALERPSAPWLVCQRDGGLWGIGGHDDADGPFGTREFAAAVAAPAPAAKGTCP